MKLKIQILHLNISQITIWEAALKQAITILQIKTFNNLKIIIVVAKFQELKILIN